MNAANGDNPYGESVSDYNYTVRAEYYINTIQNGYKTTRFGDLGIYPNEAGGNVSIFQVGRVTGSGLAVARERRAISDIESKGYYVIFIPYN